MSTMRSITLVVSLVATIAYVHSIYTGEGYFLPERECNNVGGMCILRELCEERDQTSGACPQQANKGATCCAGFPKNETRCQHLGGHCAMCRDKLVLKRALDCTANTKCCILFN